MTTKKYDKEIQDTMEIINIQRQRAVIMMRNISRLMLDYKNQLEALNVSLDALERLFEKKNEE